MPVEEGASVQRPTQDVVRDLEIGQPSNSEEMFQKLQNDVTTRKRRRAAGYRFYALCDKAQP